MKSTLASVCALGALAVIISTTASAHAGILPRFMYEFLVNGTLNESGNMSESSSPYFWVNSGGAMVLQNGKGSTLMGNVAPSKWGIMYALANPLDTDLGAHPQNIFRLVTKTSWKNMSAQVYARISDYHESASPNREGHNGILLMSRYQDDGQTLYYAGLRVDGSAVIKKKFKGTYTTLAQEKVLSGAYDRTDRPNLIPENKWIGVRSVVQNLDSKRVSIKLFLDLNTDHVWDKVLDVVDSGATGGGPIANSGYAGIRTDFMDVEFDDYRLAELW